MTSDDLYQRHLAWKRKRFPPRPPPSAAARRHRLNGHEKRPVDVSRAFAIALQLHHQAEECEKSSREAAACPLAQQQEPHSYALSTLSPSQQQWISKMDEEVKRRQSHVDLQIQSNPSHTVIIANLPAAATEADLRLFAEDFGRVVTVRLVRNRLKADGGKSRRYGFVSFGSEGEARAACRYHHQRRLHGRLIAIDMERGRSDPTFLPRRLHTARELQERLAPAPRPSEPPVATSNPEVDWLSLGVTSPGGLNGKEEDEDAFLAAVLALADE